MSATSFLRRHVPTAAFVAGIATLAFSGVLIADHARAVRETQDALPVAQRLPGLRHRLAVLRAQLEVADLEAAVRATPEEEQLRVHVLPDSAALESVLGTFELLRDQLTADGQLQSMSAIQAGEPEPVPGMEGLQSFPLTVSFSGTDQAAETLNLFMEIAGSLTVGDVLTSVETEKLLIATEEENPVAVTALEQFLAVSLLQYARNPERYEDLLARSFGSPDFLNRLHGILEASRLPAARFLLGGKFGGALEERHLWPLRFLTVDKSTLERTGDGQARLELRLMAYVRAQSAE
jgi:hypothetical protein